LALVAAAAALAVSRGGEKDPAPRAEFARTVRPAAPARYEIPSSAVSVRSSTELRHALLRSQPTDIVLSDGVYDAPGPCLNANGHRLYAAGVGGAVLRAGLSLGANAGAPGGSVQGLIFDIRDEEKTVEGAEIVVWGTAKGAAVLDVVLRGNGDVRAGLVVR
jgi:hypothetical protein